MAALRAGRRVAAGVLREQPRGLGVPSVARLLIGCDPPEQLGTQVLVHADHLITADRAPYRPAPVPLALLTSRPPFSWWIRASRWISGAPAPPDNREAPINRDNFRMMELVSEDWYVRG